MRLGLGLGVSKRLIRRLDEPVVEPPVTPPTWKPSDEIATGKYAWEASAKTAPRMVNGQTFLDDANGGPIVLSAKNGLPGSQPLWTADAGDHMPALKFARGNPAEQRLVFDNSLTLESETFAFLTRGQASTSGSEGMFAFGSGADANNIIIDAGVIGGFRYRVVTTLCNNLTQTADYTNQWICGVLEIDYAAQKVRLWLNGVLVDEENLVPTAPFTVSRFVIGGNRGFTYVPEFDFAHGIVMHEVSADMRAKLTGYLKQEWTTRVTGW